MQAKGIQPVRFRVTHFQRHIQMCAAMHLNFWCCQFVTMSGSISAASIMVFGSTLWFLGDKGQESQMNVIVHLSRAQMCHFLDFTLILCAQFNQRFSSVHFSLCPETKHVALTFDTCKCIQRTLVVGKLEPFEFCLVPPHRCSCTPHWYIDERMLFDNSFFSPNRR